MRVILKRKKHLSLQQYIKNTEVFVGAIKLKYMKKLEIFIETIFSIYFIVKHHVSCKMCSYNGPLDYISFRIFTVFEAIC